MSENAKKTKATTALEGLRKDIIQGTYCPGTRLHMDDLKHRYGVGYSPLREALFQLTTSGLVTNEEHCGFTVTDLSHHELADLYRTRLLLETQMLTLSIANGDDQWEANVMSSWHRFSKYLQPTHKDSVRPAMWDELQNEYYLALFSASNSQWLLRLSQLLSDQSERYRNACLKTIRNNKPAIKEYINDNQALVDAALNRDETLAVESLAIIYEKSLVSIQTALKLSQ